MKKIHCDHLDQVEQVATEIVHHCEHDKIWVFKGDMGAGKTTLIKSIAKSFGVKDIVSSPTFSIVNEYINDSNEKFYHFDFYRIEDPEEVLEIGIDEYFYGGAYCWIEWAEKIPEFIPDTFMLISIEVDSIGGREISISKIVNGTQHG
ncbi:tRNA (adenosine(37)-N6)-threonylcarbamoyltransferase complex ATPase subunit type 1 TsaE [Belliella sp. R4-6]|uniref:tRNA threonylcarbamoyladenosine biosynthesis protein TsaE n=1 Tax=Belliella alkalica TaxID=1730871 RepID=A0ABS9VDA7_9BACT|nr:tRNA (adenosine(37)-N6)-threonylcarbamoyltransferase complex ATPase subunit type 1 TsaE [Belliella alkalica]MCH7414411.1 tRNA (adenosine(37)-N6)-threonylcarbamoyltransferase complex ATPase subunit type 1 TsaE [Belliella alkalica]